MCSRSKYTATVVLYVVWAASCSTAQRTRTFQPLQRKIHAHQQHSSSRKRPVDQHLRVLMADVPYKYCQQAYELFPSRNVTDNAGHDQFRDYKYMDPKLHPFGQPIFDSPSLRQTSQYATERWFQVQMQSSPLLVDKYDDADVVYVCSAPFNRHWYMHDGYPDGLLQEFVEEAHQFLPHLGKKPHILVLPGVARDWFEYIDFLQNFTVFALEPYTAWDNHILNIRFQRNLTSTEIHHLNERIVPVAYMSRYHMLAGEAEHLHNTQLQDKAVQEHKQVLVSQSFSSRDWFYWRKKMLKDCRARPRFCTHFEFTAGSTASLWQSLDLMSHSWYCFQTGGDTPLRQALYDCMQMGSVPVVFHDEVMNVMPYADVMPWRRLLLHLPEALVDKEESPNIVDALRKHHSAAASLERLKTLRLHRHLLQYSLQPNHSTITYKGATETSTQDDAFTMAWKAMIRKLCGQGELPEMRCGINSGLIDSRGRGIDVARRTLDSRSHQ